MSYHDDEIRYLMEELVLWADLRHEQGANVRATLRDVKNALKRAARDLKRLRGKEALRRREPDDLASIQTLRPRGPRRLWDNLQKKGLASRLKGAWLGRAAGCTLGAIVENWPIDRMERLAKASGCAFPPTDYWASHPEPGEMRYGVSAIRDYTRGHMCAVPVDDDVTYTLLGLLILEKYGPCFTTDDVGEAWGDLLPMACTAEDVALKNLKAGVPALKAGEKDNPYCEWIGADIRSDPWGYAAPGWPERAAEMAYRDAYLSHRRNGVYGAMYFSAAIAAAFAVDDPIEALEIGLTEIPRDCRLARDLRWALKRGRQLKDWREARRAVDGRFPGMSSVHTNNNACLTVFGLMLGGGDFSKSVGITVAMGLDNDCTAATVGSILGAALGVKGVPAHWWKPFRNRTLTYLRGCPAFRNTGVIQRFMRAAEAVWEVGAS